MTEFRDPANAVQTSDAPSAQIDSTGQPTVRCTLCDADVVPSVPNHCPLCGGWVTNNAAATTHGLRSKKLAKVVDKYRVDLLSQLIKERGGRNALSVVDRLSIENYALVCAQAKTIEARLDQDGLFTTTGRRRSAFDMLRGITETIERLKSQLPPVVVQPTQQTADDLADLTRSELIARTSAALQSLLDEEDEERKSEAAITRAADPSVTPTAGLTSEEVAHTSELAPQPECPHCRRTPCLGPSHPAFDILHRNDADHVAKRDREATREMLQQIGKPLPSWYFE